MSIANMKVYVNDEQKKIVSFFIRVSLWHMTLQNYSAMHYLVIQKQCKMKEDGPSMTLQPFDSELLLPYAGKFRQRQRYGPGYRRTTFIPLLPPNSSLGHLRLLVIVMNDEEHASCAAAYSACLFVCAHREFTVILAQPATARGRAEDAGDTFV